MGPALIFVFVAIAVVFGIYWSYQQKKKRRADLETFAKQYQLQYSQTDPYGLLGGTPFHLFREGDGRGIENVMSGAWQGLPVREADYWYYTESTDSKGNRTKSYHYFSVCLAEMGASVPYVSVSKENVFTRLADHVGLRDIDFESEQFNREFNVKSPEPEFAFKLIDARMIQWLLTTGGSFGFELDGATLLAYCKRRKPTELVPLMGTAKAFHDHVPRLVWSEYGAGIPGPSAPSAPSAPAIPPAPAQTLQPSMPNQPTPPPPGTAETKGSGT
jgi:hypothetical protein